jgi:hypothetical protein
MLAVHGMTLRHVALRLRHIVMQTELAGVLPVHKGEFQPIQQSALRWSNRLKQAVAVCNSLTMVNKNTVVGVDMERSMFKAVEARFLVRSPWLLTNTEGHLATTFVVKLDVQVLGWFVDGETVRCGRAAGQMRAVHGAYLCKLHCSSKLCMSRSAEDLACLSHIYSYLGAAFCLHALLQAIRLCVCTQCQKRHVAQ